MRELKIGDQTVRVRATPLALLYYRQEFGSDLFGDLMKMVQGMAGVRAILGQNNDEVDISNIDLSHFDITMILQLVWAMAKADAFSTGEQFPSFKMWLSKLDGLDLTDPAFMTGALEEAVDGFFRSRTAGAKGGSS